MKKDIRSKWKFKENRSTHVSQSRIQTKIRRDKEGQHILTNGTIPEKDVMILNIYALNIGAPRLLKQTLVKIKG
jgi:hypothetical protein